jgi:hypothetical protein
MEKEITKVKSSGSKDSLLVFTHAVKEFPMAEMRTLNSGSRKEKRRYFIHTKRGENPAFWFMNY